MSDFRKSVLKVNGHRKHKVRGSLGVYDAYKYIRKNKWFNIGRPLTEHQFYSIIRGVNNYLGYDIITKSEIVLPERMGTIELRKRPTSVTIEDGKLKTNLPIDWDRTLKLWADDKESFDNKILIRLEEKEVFKIIYNRATALYNNKSFYEFELNRDLKRMLKDTIKHGFTDAFIYG